MLQHQGFSWQAPHEQQVLDFVFPAGMHWTVLTGKRTCTRPRLPRRDSMLPVPRWLPCSPHCSSTHPRAQTPSSGSLPLHKAPHRYRGLGLRGLFLSGGGMSKSLLPAGAMLTYYRRRECQCVRCQAVKLCYYEPPPAGAVTRVSQ